MCWKRNACKEPLYQLAAATRELSKGLRCCRYKLAAKPRKGTAILFHSIKPNGDLEKRSMHTACPVIKGEKWSAPKVRRAS